MLDVQRVMISCSKLGIEEEEAGTRGWIVRMIGVPRIACHVTILLTANNINAQKVIKRRFM